MVSILVGPLKNPTSEENEPDGDSTIIQNFLNTKTKTLADNCQWNIVKNLDLRIEFNYFS